MKSQYLDNLAICLETYGDTFAAYYAVAEIAYWEQFGVLPEWSVFIERIESYENGDLIIHRDKAPQD